MSTTTRPTQEKLLELQYLGHLYAEADELNTILTQLRNLLAVLESKRPTRVGAVTTSSAEIRETFGKLVEDLGHLSIDTYSLNQAISHTERLDKLVDEARYELMSQFEFTGADSNG